MCSYFTAFRPLSQRYCPDISQTSGICVPCILYMHCEAHCPLPEPGGPHICKKNRTHSVPTISEKEKEITDKAYTER